MTDDFDWQDLAVCSVLKLVTEKRLVSQKEIARASQDANGKNSVDTLGRFLKMETTPSTFKRNAGHYRDALRTLGIQGKLGHQSALEPVRPLLATFFPDVEAYGPNSVPAPTAAETNDDAMQPRPVQDESVRTSRPPLDPGEDRNRYDAMELVQGFWFLLRPATKSAQQDQVVSSGDLTFSLSVLNLIPYKVDDIDGFATFKIRQAGNAETRRPYFTIEGQFLPYGAGALFVGRRRLENKLFSMVAEYELPEKSPDKGGHLEEFRGLVLGVSAQKDSVATWCYALYIPNTANLQPAELEELDEELQKKIGTMTLDKAVDIMSDYDVELAQKDLGTFLSRIEARRIFALKDI